MKKNSKRHSPGRWMLTALACAMPALAQQGQPAATGSAPRVQAATPNPAPAPSNSAPASASRSRSASASPAPQAPAQPATPPCNSVSVEPPTTVTLGKSALVRLQVPVARLLVGGTPTSRAGAPGAESVEANTPPMTGLQGATAMQQLSRPVQDGVAQVDVTLLGPTELFLLGRRAGSMNLVMQTTDGRCFIRDVLVTVDPDNLQAKLAELMPGESDIRVRAMDGALVLTGQVSDALKLDQVMDVAQSLGEARRVVNMLRVSTPQQVMLEVKIAEVSKTLLDRFGIDYTRVLANGNGLGASVISGIFGGMPAVLGRISGLPGNASVTGGGGGSVSNGAASASTGVNITGSRGTALGIDAQSRDGLIRVLAEPNIMAISGQSASFLSGGKIFIPVAQARDGGGTTISLEEKEFGVGLRFTPTVLDGTRVNLKLTSEVSDLSQTGSPFTTVGGVTSVLPSLSTRRVDTTVQLGDGQSLAIAGLIKNNSTVSLNRFPGLGDIPVLGALFRSSEFQKEQTELVFVVTPRLVQPLRTAVVLPTDVHVEPSRGDVWLGGKLEGRRAPEESAPRPVPSAPAPRAQLPQTPQQPPPLPQPSQLPAQPALPQAEARAVPPVAELNPQELSQEDRDETP